MYYQSRKRKKPILPKTNRDYKTDWFLADLTDIDKQIFEIIQNFMNRTKAFRNKSLWAKYAIFLYLSGARRSEPFLSNPTISKNSEDGITFYNITRTNEKHFVGKMQKREKIPQVFRAWNKYELALFNYLLDNKDRITIDFSLLLPPRSRKILQTEDGEKYRDLTVLRNIMHDISQRFSGMFKANITNGEKIIKNGGIVPHQLRHIKAYELWINKNLPPALIQRLIGWKKLSMLEYYSYISKAMQEKEMKQIYKQMRTNNPLS